MLRCTLAERVSEFHNINHYTPSCLFRRGVGLAYLESVQKVLAYYYLSSPSLAITLSSSLVSLLCFSVPGPAHSILLI